MGGRGARREGVRRDKVAQRPAVRRSAGPSIFNDIRFARSLLHPPLLPSLIAKRPV